ncbi:MAG: rhomboid family intramembrane serine protease [Candidatus Krumholzibacteria bacterium]|nr:rhomboid family intramembrane serine protease [Candidatus Krumholzibacteria bacterium]
MFIIPVGTKATLALKPRMTIGLIAFSVAAHLVIAGIGRGAEGRLFAVQRDLFAAQMKLYLREIEGKDDGSGDYETYRIGHGISLVEQAEDWYDLELALGEAAGGSRAFFEEIEAFGATLEERSDDHYGLFTDGSELHDQWRRLKAKEEKVVGSHPNFVLGLVPNRMGRIHTFLTHIFLHGDIWHLLGNMLFLWVVGCLLEDSWGRWPFLGFYLLGGIVAGGAHCLQDISSATPLIGASGAIAAAMGAFTIRHFMTKIRFFYFFIFLFRPFWGTFHLPAFVFLPLWFIEQLVMKSISDFVGGDGVAYLAHIAGYMAGISTALIVKATDLESRWLSPMVSRKQIDEGVLKDPRFEEACGMLENGNLERGRMLFDRLLAERPDDLGLKQDIAAVCREHGLGEDACELACEAMKGLLLRSRDAEAARLALEMIADRSPASVDLSPQLLMRVGKWLVSQGRFADAHDIYRFVIGAGAVSQISAKASLALARTLAGPMNSRRDAVAVLEDARGLDVGPEMRHEIEVAIEALEREAAGPVPA